MAKRLPTHQLIPIHHIPERDREKYFARKDFFYHYEMLEPGEIGAVFDPKTGKPIMRVVCE